MVTQTGFSLPAAIQSNQERFATEFIRSSSQKNRLSQPESAEPESDEMMKCRIIQFMLESDRAP
jgi:hypothetical protein